MKDVFLEKIIAHRKTPFERFVSFLIILTSCILILFLFYVSIFLMTEGLPFFYSLPILLMLTIGIIYLSYFLLTSLSHEYEYALTNDELTIDRISGKRKRKRVFVASCKDFDRVASISDSEYIRLLESCTSFMDFSSSQRELTWYIFLVRSGKKTMLLFDYDERFIFVFRRYNPRNVITN